MRSWPALLFVAGAIGICSAQAPPPNLPPHTIHSNDLVNISIYGEPDLTIAMRVGADGQIRLPLLAQKIKADGLMPTELERAIAEAFQREQILRHPFVTVTIAEYHTLLAISVAGAVRNPITFEPIERLTLLEAITRAGGLTSDAGPEILISRPNASSQPVQRIQARALIDAADPAVNLLLEGGEEIRIPEAGKIFVAGNVKVPGAFPVQEASGATVLKIIALTQGLAPYASNEAYIYRRDAVSNSQNEIRVDLKNIMQRKSPDVPLRANDILYVPDRSGKRVTMTVLEKIFMFGAGVSTGLIYMAH